MVNSKYSDETKAEGSKLMCSIMMRRRSLELESKENQGGKREMLLQRLAEFKSHRASEAMWGAVFKAVLGNLSFKHGSDNLSDVLEKRNSVYAWPEQREQL